MPSALKEVEAERVDHEGPLNPLNTGDELDTPYGVSGITAPIYHNPIYPNSIYYVHGRDPQGIVRTIGKIPFVNGYARFQTPRQEAWVRLHLSQLLNGNSPDRWQGEDLDEDDREVCQCGFTTLNRKVAIDHYKHWKHQRHIT